MEINQKLWDIIKLVITALLPTIITVIGSQITTGDWRVWFSYVPFAIIPLATWQILFLFFFIFIIIIFIYKRIKYLKNIDSPIAIGFPSAPFGWISLGTLEYRGVTWRVTAPKDEPWGNYSISRIEVETPPRCSKCGTEIEQSHSFWGGYIWKCVGCNFEQRNRDSYYDEGRRAGKIARNEFEKRKDEN